MTENYKFNIFDRLNTIENKLNKLEKNQIQIIKNQKGISLYWILKSPFTLLTKFMKTYKENMYNKENDIEKGQENDKMFYIGEYEF